ncbi:glucose-1-phosphate adenylyltransferase [Alkalilimnicola ehrlichii MLHE-1]|uniref:Glucose-1-phosphate adenylyltransferase 1 n=1 Tax=Alkalilimnicola ehrlichii (strain ATCC BAA-1101 / DSM 17681 / MLHE-1) TaxID=187272 RepID=GLGC1_ALKEH|nr:glucose-1-phosphate adenylyltransferase [Alkalilimnicola ehrlichii]Q0AAX8.1 RecName: Full=Glucose-1-phosphate adenylyltransferase 1; AltName: Full=ADP-glucose pyrophosphorylase 1; Short=ADPGlc PPase 1; AltName: Full=ADP-glucose synthase 1 [Alkalilimnicola ehrlichii MLHE-1]ABI56009.1 glucose-1-phosphate adenylyltransferase [Alkalilimnicola ehrlichii MLHE-1]
MFLECNPRFVSRLTRDTLALIMAGGRGGRLSNLTDWRTKPAVPFGGKFRLIDFPLSNCINSGIRRIEVLTQYKAHSLIQHIQRGWGFLRGEFGEFVELVPAQQRMDKPLWYAGTADAVYQNIDIIKAHNPSYVLVLAGDHVYKMDYGGMIARHAESGAAMTVGCVEVPRKRASAFGVMSVNEERQVLAFNEKPKDPTPMPGNPDRALVSMGIYVFDRDYLFQLLREDAENFDSSRDFGKDVIPNAIANHKVQAYPFSDPVSGQQAYWRDVGTVDAFFQANMELIGEDPELNLYDEEWPIWTYQAQLPPAKFIQGRDGRHGTAINSMVSGGDIIHGAEVRDSLLFSQVVVQPGATVHEAVILPDVRVGEGCRIRKAVIDEGCRIPAGTVIGEDPAEDRRRFFVTPKDVVLVTAEMLGQEVAHVR